MLKKNKKKDGICERDQLIFLNTTLKRFKLLETIIVSTITIVIFGKALIRCMHSWYLPHEWIAHAPNSAENKIETWMTRTRRYVGYSGGRLHFCGCPDFHSLSCIWRTFHNVSVSGRVLRPTTEMEKPRDLPSLETWRIGQGHLSVQDQAIRHNHLGFWTWG